MSGICAHRARAHTHTRNALISHILSNRIAAVPLKLMQLPWANLPTYSNQLRISA